MLVSQFLTNLKRRGQYQAASTVLSDADYVAFANDQLRSVIAPKMLSLRDNYFACIKDYTLTTSRRYRIPAHCMGGRIQTIKIISGSEQWTLPQMPNTDQSNSVRRGFYVSQGDIILTGQLPTGTMRVVYPCRLPTMDTTATSVITVVAVNATSLTLSATHHAAGDHTIIRKDAPHRPISSNIITTGTTNAVDGDCSDYTRYQVGDVLLHNAPQDTTKYVPLQVQLCDWLLQRTHMRVLQALGQTDQLQAAGSKLADIQKDVMALLSPRVQNSPKVIFGGQVSGWNWRE